MISLAHINIALSVAKINRKLETAKGFYDFRHVLIEKYHELSEKKEKRFSRLQKEKKVQDMKQSRFIVAALSMSCITTRCV